MRSGLLLAMVLVGCGCPCDVDAHVRARAGDAPIDCGYVPLGGDRGAALDCAEGAIAAGRGVLVGWQRQGVDSEVSTYLAGHDGAFWMFGYDGDPSGGSHACATLSEAPCTEAPTRMTLPNDGEVLTCTGNTSTALCH